MFARGTLLSCMKAARCQEVAYVTWPEPSLLGSPEQMLVTKQNLCGEPRISYPAQVIEYTGDGIQLHTRWTETADYGLFSMEKGDPVLEDFASGRWYSVLKLMDSEHRLVGWYCDICRPPELGRCSDGRWHLSYRDMELDIFVDPRRRPTVLDRRKFQTRIIPRVGPETAEHCRSAARELLRRASRGLPPFDGS